MNSGRPPLIVIGMHRSGTTLLSRLLQRCGVFMGGNQNRNAEPRFITALNGWLFAQASATWDRPEGMADLLIDERLRPWLVDYMDGLVRGPAAGRFLGPRRALRYGSLHALVEPWGFKDPRTTYTLDYWLELFPQARVVHILRHGADVAVSLAERRERALKSNLERYRRRRWLYVMRPDAPKRRGFAAQPRCRTLAGGFELWERYVERARTHVAASTHGLEIGYEALLATPQTELARVLDFAGIDTDATVLSAATSGLDAGRAHAWRHHAEARALAAARADVLARLGYGTEVE